MNKLPKDHPEVIALHRQLQEQHENIGRISAFVGMMNVDYLRKELWERGWNTRLADDKITVVLLEREERGDRRSMNIGDYANGIAFPDENKPSELTGGCAGVIIGIFQNGTVELQGELHPMTPYVCRAEDVCVVPDHRLWGGTKEFVMQWRSSHRNILGGEGYIV